MKKNGFSLIELLVSITILMLIVGGGIASYLTFNEKQQVAGAAKELQTYFRSAQTRARSGDVPEGCDSLNSYQVTVAQDSIVHIIANCSNDNILRSEHVLNNSVAPSALVDIKFLGLRGGVIGEQTVTLTRGDFSYSFKVSAGGEITEGGFDE